MKTCLKFRPRHPHDRDYILITGDSGGGCWTTVGRRGGKQIVNLNVRDNCVTFGRVLHELMHVLGFYHQHSASNRDQYVEVVWKNILKAKNYNFLRYNSSEVTDFGVPYDFDSILHYPADAASKNGKPTLVALKSNVLIGQRMRLSKGDIIKINRMYHKECGHRGSVTDQIRAEKGNNFVHLSPNSVSRYFGKSGIRSNRFSTTSLKEISSTSSRLYRRPVILPPSIIQRNEKFIPPEPRPTDILNSKAPEQYLIQSTQGVIPTVPSDHYFRISPFFTLTKVKFPQRLVSVNGYKSIHGTIQVNNSSSMVKFCTIVSSFLILLSHLLFL